MPVEETGFMNTNRIAFCSLIVVLVMMLVPVGVMAFPPYKSTDADTADPWVFEMRVGLLRWKNDGGENEPIAPLGRYNLGLPYRLEAIVEFEYSQDDHASDLAAGGKWIPFWWPEVSAGMEVLALLPSGGQDGMGVEAQAVATWRNDTFQVHFNAGGFYDGRFEEPEKGWRAGTLVECCMDGCKPGIELFGKQVSGEDVQLSAGAGVIIPVGCLQLRIGARAGITDSAPDFDASLWVAGKIPLK